MGARAEIVVYENEPNARDRLIAIISTKSLTTGEETTLASGEISKFYFDMRHTTFDPEASNIISRLILDLLEDQQIDFIGGLELGAVPIVACITQMSLATNGIPGFCVRKQVKEHGKRKLIEGVHKGDLDGKKAILVDDVTTTGGSVLQAVEAARSEGAIVDTVITVVDRNEGAIENLAAHGIKLISLLTATDFEI